MTKLINENTQDMTDLPISRWQDEVYTLAKSKGWYDNPDPKAHAEMARLAIGASLQLNTYTEDVRQGDVLPLQMVSALGDVRHLSPDQHVKLARLWLIASEVFEAIETVIEGKDAQAPVYYTSTEGKPEGLGVELADIAIRLLDFCEAYQIPLESYMLLKHTYNESRPHRHGGKNV